MDSSFRHFLRGFISVTILIVSGFICAYIISQRVAPVYPNAQARSSLFTEAADSIVAASFGNSHNLALHFQSMELKGFHLWWGGGDIFEASRAFEETIKEAHNLKYAFVTVPPFAFDNAGLSNIRPERADIRRKYYIEYLNFIPITSDWKIAFHAALSPVARPDNWENVVLRALGRDLPAIGMQTNGFLGTRKDVDLTREEVEEFANVRSKNHISIEKISLEQNPDLCNDLKKSYQQIATMGGKSDVRIILYTPPYTKAYKERMSKMGNKCQTVGIAEQIAFNRDHVWYFNFSGDEVLTSDISLFRDSDHLDREGARIFSAHFKTELIKERVLFED